jgi:hypothetical protein
MVEQKDTRGHVRILLAGGSVNPVEGT